MLSQLLTATPIQNTVFEGDFMLLSDGTKYGTLLQSIVNMWVAFIFEFATFVDPLYHT